jgi:endonuclease/exonuclease/phosphatase family metal-dependent hydrolase
MVRLSKNYKWPFFFIISLNTLFGLQILKTFLSLLVNFLRERPGISLVDVAVYALVTFLVVFLTGFLYKSGYRFTIFFLTAGICLARIILQLSSWGPLSLAVSAAGVILWMAGIVLFISLAHQPESDWSKLLIPSFIFGFSLETAVHGIYGTWDMVWRKDPVSISLVLAIAVIQIWLTCKVRESLTNAEPSDGGRTCFYTLIPIMPFILIQLLKFQNIASLNAFWETNLSLPLALILSSNILAFLLILLYRNKKFIIPLTVIGSAFLLLSFYPVDSPLLYALQVSAGNICSFWLFAVLLNRTAGISRENKIPWNYTFSIGLGGLIFFILAFLYYGSYDISLPFDAWVFTEIAAALIAFCGLLSVFLSRVKDNIKYIDTAASFIPILVLLLTLFLSPAILSVDSGLKRPFEQENESIRVMDYNIHQGFNIDGYLDLETIARVIEGSGADIVGLQEVSRGWLINGSADTLYWLSKRLDMEYIFMPASDDVWGNAVLSTYPVEFLKGGFLPGIEAPLRRSYLLANINIPEGRDINIMVTHLHHIMDEGDIREKQVEEILEQWNGLPGTVIMGDFNAQKGDPEIEKMYSSGLIDAQYALGNEDDPTWVHYPPQRRIDYIWTTPDIELIDGEVPYSTASDHLPVVVELK